jgi:hypothetical protein
MLGDNWERLPDRLSRVGIGTESGPFEFLFLPRHAPAGKGRLTFRLAQVVPGPTFFMDPDDQLSRH